MDSLSGQQRTGGGTIANFNDAADASARRGVYDEFTADAYKDYWKDRIGLDPDATGARDGNLQEQTNWAKDAVGASNSPDATDANYGTSNLNARFNYLGALVGLDPNAVGDRGATDLTARITSLVDRAGARTDNAGAAIEVAADDATRLTAYRDASSFGQNNYWATRVGLDVNARIAKAGVLADFSALNSATPYPEHQLRRR